MNIRVIINVFHSNIVICQRSNNLKQYCSSVNMVEYCTQDVNYILHQDLYTAIYINMIRGINEEILTYFLLSHCVPYKLN